MSKEAKHNDQPTIEYLQQIATGNSIIASFVGLEEKSWAACFQPVAIYYEGDFLKKVWRLKHPYFNLIDNDNRASNLYFACSMDWIIPAFVEFKNRKIDHSILAHEKEHRADDILESIANNDLENAFKKLVQHIEWYNDAVKQELIKPIS